MTKNKKYPKPQVIGFMPMVSDGNEIWGFEISELSKEEQHDLKKKVCPKCQGDGKVWADGRKHYPFAHFPTKDCPECRGRGTLIDRLEPCGECNGSGTVQLEIPKETIEQSKF